jgi:chemotaxis family two-component system response regulator Rcp1
MSIPTILVIEDNMADVFLISYFLDEQGEEYRLEVLPDGEAVLAFVAEHRMGFRRHEPCVILLDLHLPKYNGIEVLTAIKEEPVLTHIHVVVLTSSASPADHVTTLGGICRIKPPDVDAVKTLAMEIMAICKGRSQRLTMAARPRSTAEKVSGSPRRTRADRSSD